MNPNMNSMYMNMNSQMKMNMCPMNMMMNQFQMMMMNNMNNNNLNNSGQFSNCPTMKSFMNYKYYNLRNQDALNDSNLSQTEKNLSIFFDCICDFNKNINNFGTKIYINYNNLEKIELYLDLSLQVKYLVSIIFGLILSKSDVKNYYIRMEKNQTTKQIIQNPINFYGSDSLYKNTIYLEFNNIDLNQISERTGFEIGLKEGDELLLKLKKKCYNELKSLKIENIIKFKENGDDKNIICFPSFKEEIISNMIKRFIKYINADYDKCYFIFNGDNLNNNSKKIKDILALNSIIDFQHPSLIGGLEFIFTDVSKEKIKNLKFSKTAPVWRKVKEGLNIFGFCPDKGCITNKKEVVYIPKAMDIKDNHFMFNIIEERENMLCPICKTIIKAKTIGFYKCEYQIIGRKIENGKLIEYDSKPKETKDDNFEYFSPDENGEVEWTKLFVYILPKQKIKYQSNQ